MASFSTRELRDALRAIPLFSALTAPDLSALLEHAGTVTAGAGEEIFSPEEAAESFYVILSGQVKVYQLSSRGDEQIFHLYGRGQTFGEAAMWSGERYPAFASALRETRLLKVDREALLQMIRHRPEAAVAMLAGLSLKLREFNHLIEQLALREVPGRLAQVILDLAEEAGANRIELRYSKRELAARIGTVSETLSRALRRLQQDGLIQVAGARITILDREGLEDLAAG